EQRYTVWLPERLAATATYSARVPAIDGGPRDELGRLLAEPFDVEFVTDHRPPDYTLPYSTAVLEAGIDSDVPLYVTNLDRAELRYRALDGGGLETGRTHAIELSEAEDVQY